VYGKRLLGFENGYYRFWLWCVAGNLCEKCVKPCVLKIAYDEIVFCCAFFILPVLKKIGV